MAELNRVDWFAGMALQGLIARGILCDDKVAAKAVEMAKELEALLHPATKPAPSAPASVTPTA